MVKYVGMKTTSNIWEQLRGRPSVVLAPMDDVTDLVFRQLVQEIAPADLYFTEFANADGFASPGRHAIERRLRLGTHEGPVIAQIWGLKPDNFQTMAAELATRDFAGIDLNMGCPAKDVLKKGACSGLIKTPELAAEMIAATKAGAGDLPVSVKTRIGYHEVEMGWIEHILSQDIAALTVHLRTVKEQSKVEAHWELMGDIIALRDRIAPQTLIYGNGDVEDRGQAERLIAETGCDGIMIGRGIFHNPWAFSSTQVEHTQTERAATLLRHLEIWVQEVDEEYRARRFETLKRFFKIYINGFAGAAELRNQLMQCHDVLSVREILQ